MAEFTLPQGYLEPEKDHNIAAIRARVQKLEELVATYEKIPFPCHDYMTEQQWADICNLVAQRRAALTENPR